MFIATILVALSTAAFANPAVPMIDKQSAVGVRGDVERAMWVTNCEDIVYNVGTAKADFFAFCENPLGLLDMGASAFSRHPINHLFFSAHGFVVSGPEEKDSLRSFIREAHTRGLRVDYLDGEATWITKDAGEAHVVISSVVDYNKTSTEDERFDGVMLDVQPYTLRGWFTPILWGQYMAFLKNMHSNLQSAGLDFGATIPRWYDATLGKDALAEVYNNVNFVTVLDYVDQDRTAIESISGEIELANTMNVRVYAGVETASNVLSSVTFQDRGWLAMEHALASVNSAYMFDKSYAGIAISNYGTYHAMRRAPHAIDLSSTSSAYTGKTMADLTGANANVVVLDSAVDHLTEVSRKDLQKLQSGNGFHKTVLAGLSIGTFLDVAAHPGAPAGDVTAWTLTGQNGPVASMKAAVTKLMALGFDGFAIDLTPAVDLAEKLNSPELELAIAVTLRQIGTLARETCKHSSAVIVARGGESLLNSLDADSYGDFVATVDGMIPTRVTAPPVNGNLLSALDRDRFYIYASLEQVAHRGLKVFGNFNFQVSPELVAQSHPVNVVPMMAGLMEENGLLQ